MTPTLRWLRQENYHVSKVSLACIARSHLKQNEETKKQIKSDRERVTETRGWTHMEYTLHTYENVIIKLITMYN